VVLQGSNALDKAKPISGEISVDASSFETSDILFFDRFRIEPGPIFFELHFGFYGQARDARSGLMVVFARQTIGEAKQSMLDYLQQLGAMPEPTELLPCKLPAETKAVPADVVGVARHGTVAEIIFHTFSWRTAVERARAGNTKKEEGLKAICTALLRCDLEVQKRWILALYEDETDDSNP
jgi:hypothetical protein